MRSNMALKRTTWKCLDQGNWHLKQTFYEGLFHGYSTYYILPISTLKAKKLQISFNHGNAWCLVKKINNLNSGHLPKETHFEHGHCTARICVDWMLPHITNKRHHLGRPWNDPSDLLLCQDTAIKNLALRTTNQKKYLAQGVSGGF